jgi:predicted phosphodiesterase
MNGIPVPIRGYDNGLIGSVALGTGFDGIDDWCDIPHDPRLQFDKVLEGFTYHIKFAPCNYDLSNGHPQTIFAKKDPATTGGYENAVIAGIHDDGSVRTKLSFGGEEYTASAVGYLYDKELMCGITKWYDLTVKFDSIREKLTMLLNNVVFRDEWTNPQTTPYPFHDINWHLGRNTYTNRGLFWGGLGDFRYYHDLCFTSEHNDNLFTNRISIAKIPYGHAAVVGHSYIRDAPDLGVIAGFELPIESGEGFLTGHFMFASTPIENDLVVVYNIQSLPKVEGDLHIVYDIEYAYPTSNDLQIVYDIEGGPDTEEKVTNDLVIAYSIGQATTPPPDPCPSGYTWSPTLQYCVLNSGGGGGGGGGAHGGMDSLGLQWYAATGAQDLIPQSRNASGDDRWSRNYSNLDTGYEVICYGVFNGTSGGHLAFKIAGGNHSGDCYEVSYGGDTGCGSWYDTGFHMDGSWNIQVERIHTSQQWDWTPTALQKANLGVSTDGATLGLRILYFPVLEHGSTDNGGIRLMMWVDTSGYLNGKPQNKWELVFDELDTGQVMRTPYKPPVDQEVEMRNSDTSSQTLFGGGVHMRRINRATDLPIGSGGGGTQPPNPPVCPGNMHWDATQNKCITNTPIPPDNPPPPPPPTTSGGLVAIIGDTDCVSATDNNYAQIKAKNAQQILHTGDMTYDSDADCYIQKLQNAFNATQLTTMLVTWGNHDHPNEDGNNTILDQLRTFHNVDSTLLKQKQFGNFYIISMNTQDGSIDSTSGTQYQFVLSKLQEAQGLRNQGQIDWIIVIMHKPMYAAPSQNHAPDEENHTDVYSPIFDQYGVDFVFNGHNHNLVRSEPIKSGGSSLFTKTAAGIYDFKQPHGQFYIASGAGGRDLYSSGTSSLYPFVNDNTYGFWLITPNSTGKILLVQCISRTGSMLHEFQVSRA